MSARYSIAEARNQLPAIVHAAEEGSVAELTRRGKPVAVVLSFADYKRLTRALQEFRKSHALGDLDVDEIFDSVRDRAPGREVKW